MPKNPNDQNNAKLREYLEIFERTNEKYESLRKDFRAGDIASSGKSDRMALEKLYEERLGAAQALMDITFDERAAVAIAGDYLYRCQLAYDDYMRSGNENDRRNYQALTEKLIPEMIALGKQMENPDTGELYLLLAQIHEGIHAVPYEYNRPSVAFHYYRKASRCGHGEADLRLAEILFAHKRFDETNKHYNQLLDSAIRRGSTAAMLRRGTHLIGDEAGSMNKRDHDEAFNLFFDGVRLFDKDPYGDVHTLSSLKYRLGFCYYYGLGTKKNQDKALILITEAASLNSAAAAFLKKWNKGDLETTWSPLSGIKYDRQSPENHVEAEDKSKTKPPEGGFNPFEKFSDKNHKAFIFEEEPEHSIKVPHDVHEIIIEQAMMSPDHPVRKMGREEWEPLPQTQTPELSDEEIEDLLKPLDDMIGLHRVKKEVRNLIALMKARHMRQKQGLSTPAVNLHSIFMGPPGTGKTTVARLLGEILAKMGHLAHGHVIEVDHSELIGEYVGQTGPMTLEKIKKARGGILFIDEAYMLAHDERFGPEAIATLLKNMEDRRDEFMVIAAGYTNEMKSFLASNTGFRSRFANLIEFDPYSTEELTAIFIDMCSDQSYAPSDEALERVRSVLKREKRGGHLSISNARGVRDLFEKTIRKQSIRIAALPNDSAVEDLMEIRAEDIFDQKDANKDNVVFLGDSD